MPEFFTRAEAADYLSERGFPTAKNTLQKMATVGGGPPYRLYGNRALYTPADLDAWAEAKLSPPRTSTSEQQHDAEAEVSLPRATPSEQLHEPA